MDSAAMETPKKNILDRLLQKSPFELFCAALNYLPFKPIEVGLFFSLQASGILTNHRRDCGVTIREGKEADIESLTRCIDKRGRFLARFRKGDSCLIALEEGEVVGFLWFSVRDIYEEELMHYRFPLPSNVVYSYDEYVRPAHRQKGILSQLFAVLCEWMAWHGKDTVLILIAHDNTISWRAHLKRGFTPLNQIIYLRIICWRYYHIRPARLSNKRLAQL